LSIVFCQLGAVLQTYMNMPRYMDLLLEKCGSRRAFARGEFNEPHGPLGLDVTEAPTWAPGMWEALKAAVEDPSVPSVAWDALWSSAESPVNQNVTEWDMKKLMLKSKPKPSQAPSIFAKL